MATEEEIRLDVELGTGPQAVSAFTQSSCRPKDARSPHSFRSRRLVAFLLDWFIAGYAIYIGLFVVDALIHALWLPSKIAANPALDIIGYTWRQSEGVTTMGGVTLPKFLFFLLTSLPIPILLQFTNDTLGLRLIGRSRPVSPLEGQPWYRTLWVFTAVVLGIETFMAGWYISEMDPIFIFQRFPRGWRISKQLLTPDWGVFWPSVQLMLESIFLALIATIFSIILAVPLAFLGARNLMRGSRVRMAIYTIVRGFFNIFRSIQELVFAIIFVTVVGIGPFAGMLALFIHSVASLGKLYSEQIESIDPGPMEAITATGATRLQTVLYAVAPQVMPPFLAFTIYRWDINVRTSIVVGFVGGGGIGLALFQYQQLTQWHRVGTVAFLTIIVVWALDALSARVREKLI
ncbi:MAG: phosphonate ABC transporter, permease protein PhnE [Thermomicrobia bacterium]|nr:phosphonate ABC transporter, permease protein PhnE [Thermomicrobia bacterium]